MGPWIKIKANRCVVASVASVQQMIIANQDKNVKTGGIVTARTLKSTKTRNNNPLTSQDSKRRKAVCIKKFANILYDG